MATKRKNVESKNMLKSANPVEQAANPVEQAANPVEQAETPTGTRAPSTAMLTLFSSPASIEAKLAKLERRNLPQMIKPDSVPLDSIVSGQIIKIVNSPVSTVKGKLLWMRHESGREFLFPCTGVIRSALAPGVGADDPTLQKVLEEFVGKNFYARRLPNCPSKYKREMFLFDVYTD